MRQISSSSGSVRRAPVGLFGVQMMISLVRGETRRCSSDVSAAHRPEAVSGRSFHSRTVPPNARVSPQVCM